MSPKIVIAPQVCSALRRLKKSLVAEREFKKRWREHVARQKQAAKKS
jgi:hypothetical protein